MYPLPGFYLVLFHPYSYPFPVQLLFIILKQSQLSFLHDLFLNHADFKTCMIEKQYSMGKTWVWVLIAKEWVNLGESQAGYFEEWMWGLGRRHGATCPFS